jgi:GT2 family glycosyltransferase
LEQCLHTVLKAVDQIESEIWVVDNQSTDGSMAYLKPLFPTVYFIENQKNTGFGAANNQALARCSGKYILFLNPDTLIPEDCLRNCLSFMKSHANAGALGIRMLDGSGIFLPESKRAFPSPIRAFYKLIGFSALFPKSARFNRYSLGHLNSKENHEVDVLAGAYMMVSKSILDETGGFDERFFMYGEDIDLSYRIQKAGYTNYYFAGSSIIHFKGESTRKGSMNYVILFLMPCFYLSKKTTVEPKPGFLDFLFRQQLYLEACFQRSIK